MQAPTWSVATVQEAGRSCRRGRASAARGPLLPSVKAKFSAQSQLMWSDAFGFISSSESLDTMHNRPGVTCMYQYVPQTLSTYVQSLPEMQSRNREHRVTSTLETGCDFGQSTARAANKTKVKFWLHASQAGSTASASSHCSKSAKA